jgi:hypothetical protein
MQMGQQIEYMNCLDLQNTTIAISFMARAVTSNAGSTALTVRTRTIAGIDGACIFTGSNSDTAITLTTTWTRYTVTRTLPATFGSLSLEFILGSHVSGDGIMLSQIQLEPGSVATPFERRSYGQELALCQRYCLVDTNDSTAYRWFASGFTKSTTLADFGRQFPVTMRTAPSITVSGTWLVDGPTFGVTPTSVTDTGFASRSTGRITITAASGLVASNPVWLASDGTTNLRSITYSAEL